jgi:hypothetical protein
MDLSTSRWCEINFDPDRTVASRQLLLNPELFELSCSPRVPLAYLMMGELAEV